MDCQTAITCVKFGRFLSNTDTLELKLIRDVLLCMDSSPHAHDGCQSENCKDVLLKCSENIGRALKNPTKDFDKEVDYISCYRHFIEYAQCKELIKFLDGIISMNS